MNRVPAGVNSPCHMSVEDERKRVGQALGGGEGGRWWWPIVIPGVEMGGAGRRGTAAPGVSAGGLHGASGAPRMCAPTCEQGEDMEGVVGAAELGEDDLAELSDADKEEVRVARSFGAGTGEDTETHVDEVEAGAAEVAPMAAGQGRVGTDGVAGEAAGGTEPMEQAQGDEVKQARPMRIRKRMPEERRSVVEEEGALVAIAIVPKFGGSFLDDATTVAPSAGMTSNRRDNAAALAAEALGHEMAGRLQCLSFAHEVPVSQHGKPVAKGHKVHYYVAMLPETELAAALAAREEREPEGGGFGWKKAGASTFPALGSGDGASTYLEVEGTYEKRSVGLPASSAGRSETFRACVCRAEHVRRLPMLAEYGWGTRDPLVYHCLLSVMDTQMVRIDVPEFCDVAADVLEESLQQRMAPQAADGWVLTIENQEAGYAKAGGSRIPSGMMGKAELKWTGKGSPDVGTAFVPVFGLFPHSVGVDSGGYLDPGSDETFKEVEVFWTFLDGDIKPMPVVVEPPAEGAQAERLGYEATPRNKEWVEGPKKSSFLAVGGWRSLHATGGQREGKGSGVTPMHAARRSFSEARGSPAGGKGGKGKGEGGGGQLGKREVIDNWAGALVRRNQEVIEKELGMRRYCVCGLAAQAGGKDIFHYLEDNGGLVKYGRNDWGEPHEAVPWGRFVMRWEPVAGLFMVPPGLRKVACPPAKGCVHAPCASVRMWREAGRPEDAWEQAAMAAENFLAQAGERGDETPIHANHQEQGAGVEAAAGFEDEEEGEGEDEEAEEEGELSGDGSNSEEGGGTVISDGEVLNYTDAGASPPKRARVAQRAAGSPNAGRYGRGGRGGTRAHQSPSGSRGAPSSAAADHRADRHSHPPPAQDGDRQAGLMGSLCEMDDEGGKEVRDLRDVEVLRLSEKASGAISSEWACEYDTMEGARQAWKRAKGAATSKKTACHVEGVRRAMKAYMEQVPGAGGVVARVEMSLVHVWDDVQDQVDFQGHWYHFMEALALLAAHGLLRSANAEKTVFVFSGRGYLRRGSSEERRGHGAVDKQVAQAVSGGKSRVASSSSGIAKKTAAAKGVKSKVAAAAAGAVSTTGVEGRGEMWQVATASARSRGKGAVPQPQQAQVYRSGSSGASGSGMRLEAGGEQGALERRARHDERRKTEHGQGRSRSDERDRSRVRHTEAKGMDSDDDENL